jgi:thioredoxin 1
MPKKTEPSLILKFTLLPFLLLILLFPYGTSFSQAPADRIPKDLIKIPLPKLLDFGAGKCIPCKKMAPILKELADEYKGRVIIRIIEIHEERELTRRNRIRLIPTQIFFDSNNREILRHEGFMAKNEIRKVLDKMGIQ